MKTATIRQIRNDLGTVLHWIAEGEEVTVLNRRQPVARMLPAHPETPATFALPDFAARVQRIFGQRRTHAVKELLKERKVTRW